MLNATFREGFNTKKIQDLGRVSFLKNCESFSDLNRGSYRGENSFLAYLEDLDHVSYLYKKETKGLHICFGTHPELDMKLFVSSLYKKIKYSLKEAPRPKLKITIHWTSLIMILLLVSGIDI